MPQYNKTDKIFHAISQVLAKTNRAFLEARPDDSHTNLSFDPVFKRLNSRFFEAAKGKRMLSLDIEKMQLILLNEKLQPLNDVPVVAVEQKQINQVEQQLAEIFSLTGLNTTEFLKPMHYEIPDYGLSDSALPKLSHEDKTDWMHYRTLANNTCNFVNDALQQNTEIRIWPHHFDTGVYLPLNTGPGIGFGLAMYDDIGKDAYFYLAGYNSTGFDYEKITPLTHGSWQITSGFKGAVLPLSDIDKSKEEQNVTTFIRESLRWYLKQEG